mmetsp:Transcript_19161/g.39912  ORF Transcript_19161/g.39912 Transcript_19161/m.39912 type:complete len:167 (-) Transcript_19161:111-611(-)|eukprot:CAMPEP_0118665240 /NCGR_PEP_ID=MMETSP0785-20121206/18509_1 /TAXON_ID=91992 /ORGANISM="Bolidomonas pacifica, Strain CCMP 1866" /LENGTH=166 /DNA_ID=CAMNT_0006559337 /DNA_START=145 /DNA_END=645 /DNA_ORIENTATION=-
MDNDVTDASTLSFGALFPAPDDLEATTDPILSVAEVYAITNHFLQNSAGSEEDANEVLKKVHGYGRRFHGMGMGGISTGGQFEQLNNMLQDLRDGLLKKTFMSNSTGEELKLHEYEASKLMDLMSTTSTSDEAKCLIPSLKKFTDGQVEEYLELVKKAKLKISEIS